MAPHSPARHVNEVCWQYATSEDPRQILRQAEDRKHTRVVVRLQLSTNMTFNIPRSPDRLMCGVCRHLRTLGSPRQVLGHRQEQDAGACEGDGEVLFFSINAALMAPHSPARHVNEVCWQYATSEDHVKFFGKQKTESTQGWW